jgi:hypothetical protein
MTISIELVEIKNILNNITEKALHISANQRKALYKFIPDISTFLVQYTDKYLVFNEKSTFDHWRYILQNNNLGILQITYENKFLGLMEYDETLILNKIKKILEDFE